MKTRLSPAYIAILFIFIIGLILSCKPQKQKSEQTEKYIEVINISDSLEIQQNNSFKHAEIIEETSLPRDKKIEFYLPKGKNEQIFGFNLNKLDNKEAVFEIELPENLAESKFYLQYNLYGASDYTHINRRINDGLVLGGQYIIQDTIWRFQEEEIAFEELKKGNNQIRFQAPVGFEGTFMIKDLQLKIIPIETNQLREIVINQPENKYYYNDFGYLRGFVRGEGSKTARITINGKKASIKNSAFECLVKRPMGTKGNK